MSRVCFCVLINRESRFKCILQ